MTWTELGAMSFGAVIGWFLYLINRYRKGDVQFGDITTVVGAIGGGAVTALFPQSGNLFGAYGFGLALGFFGYFVILMAMVALSRNFNIDYFLDGRRKKLGDNEIIPEGWRPSILSYDKTE